MWEKTEPQEAAEPALTAEVGVNHPGLQGSTGIGTVTYCYQQPVTVPLSLAVLSTAARGSFSSLLTSSMSSTGKVLLDVLENYCSSPKDCLGDPPLSFRVSRRPFLENLPFPTSNPQDSTEVADSSLDTLLPHTKCTHMNVLTFADYGTRSLARPTKLLAPMPVLWQPEVNLG